VTFAARILRLPGRLAFHATLPFRRVWRAWRWLAPGSAAPPPAGLVRFGDLRRLEPLSREWGLDRGGPLDRYYIEAFLRRHQGDVRGRVLEIAEDVYSRWFGGSDVDRIDILQYREGEHPRAAFTGDITDAPELPADTFDCVIITQTLQLIYDVPAAIRTIHRVLKPGGVVLITVPGISQVNRQDTETWGDVWCWMFTRLSLSRLLAERFPDRGIEVRAHGNVLVAAGFLYGMGQDDLSRKELDAHDPDYEVLITGWARKPLEPGS
jgi:SAM-dependent methyltransferase